MNHVKRLAIGAVTALLLLLTGSGSVLAANPNLAASDIKTQLVLFSLKKGEPLLDGKLDDACWQGAQKAVGFMPLGKIQPVQPGSEVTSCYNDTILYFGARATEPNMAELSTPHRIWRGDSFEIFMAPDRQTNIYYQILIGASGAYQVQRHSEAGNSQIEVPLTVATYRGDNYWSVEIAIPFASLNAALPQDNQRWAFNVGRNRPSRSTQRAMGGDGMEHFTWAYLGNWIEWSRLGDLAFYSRAEIDADLEYWRNSDRDPLMSRKEVSGIKVASASGAGQKTLPDLWTYYPFDADRGPAYSNGTFLQSLLRSHRFSASRMPFKEEHPICYQTATTINNLLLQKSVCDDSLTALKRILFYTEQHLDVTGIDLGTVKSTVLNMERQSESINKTLNDAFHAYGTAFGNNIDPNAMAALQPQLAAIGQQISGLEQSIGVLSATLTKTVQQAVSWQAKDLHYAEGQKVLNEQGLNTRLQYIWYSYFDDAHNEPLIPTYDAVKIDWRNTVPDGGPAKAEASLDQWTFDRFRNTLVRKQGPSHSRGIAVNPVMSISQLPACKELIDAVNTDGDILNTSYDGYSYNYQNDFWATAGCIGGLNYNNTAFWTTTEAYIKALGNVLNEMQITPTFLVSTWEGNYPYYVDVEDQNKKGYRQQRLPGYNLTQKQAFRTYLQGRYNSLDDLNAKWHSTYKTFDAIEPPIDKNIEPAAQVSGLTYEFERFTRVNFIRYQAKLRQLYHQYIPESPVMPDPSRLMLDGNAYLMYKEHAGDYMSFHMNPQFDEVMWTYFRTMNRTFGNVTGIYENYHGMYSGVHLNNERLAKRDFSKMFFDMFTHDVRLSTWWITEMLHPTAYVVSYNYNTCYLDYYQTIYRWSMTELPVMFRRGRAVEKVLVESAPEIPVTAIIQPCSSVFNLAAMKTVDSGSKLMPSPTVAIMFDLHTLMLKPDNLPHDYIPEEMVLDGLASLENYKLLFLPYAPYMSEAFSAQIKQWVEHGGTLVTFGPFALMDPYGTDLPQDQSLFRTLFTNYKQTGPDSFDYSLCGAASQDEPSVIKRSVGKGTLIQLNRSTSFCSQNTAMKDQLDRIMAGFDVLKTADSANDDLEIMVREASDGTRYLCLCNSNVNDIVTANVRITGTYRQALDIVAPGWFPVPFKTEQNRIVMPISLGPGEWTIINLLK